MGISDARVRSHEPVGPIGHDVRHDVDEETPLGPLRFLVHTQQFHKGVVGGLIVAGVVAGAWGATRRRSLPGAGVAFALAAGVALDRAGIVAAGHRLPVAVLGGAAMAFVLAELAIRARPGVGVLAVAAVPGGLVIAGALVGVPGWIRAVTVAVCALGGACVADFDARNARSGAAPLMWLITVGAVYSTVPDTEAARALIGAAIPVACLGWPVVYARLGAGGAAASVCLLAWVIGQDGAGRDGAVIGAAGALAVFALEPLVRRLRAGAHEIDARRAVAFWPTAVLHLVCALAAARWAGLAHDAATAMLRLLLVLAIALVLTWSIEPVA